MISGNPLKTANIPQNGVTCVAVGERYADIREILLSCGMNVLSVPESPKLNRAISSHADMLFCDLGGGECVVENATSDFAESLRSIGFKVYSLTKEIKSEYPNDALLNAVVLKDIVISSKHAEPLILEKSAEKDRKFIKVNQGYTKCSICPINSNAIITSDSGIAKECRKNGMDVLLITPGYIDLPGYDYGFIGGCSSMLSPKLLCFTGDIKTHPDSMEIESFCRNYGIDILNLSVTGTKLHDVGSVLPLLER